MNDITLTRWRSAPPVIPCLVVLTFGPLWVASLFGLREIASEALPAEWEGTLLGHDFHMAVYAVIVSAVLLSVVVICASLIVGRHFYRWFSPQKISFVRDPP